MLFFKFSCVSQSRSIEEEIATIKAEAYQKQDAFDYHSDISDTLAKLHIATDENTRELKEQHATLKSHNGRLTKVEKIMLIVGSVTVTLLVVNGSKLLAVIGILI